MHPRVLTISKPYVAKAYRNKLTKLAALDQCDVGLICPPQWGSQAFEPDAGDAAPFWMRTVPIVLNGKNHFHLYRGLMKTARAFAPDIINVEEEHYSLVTLQAFRVARRLGAGAIFYTWQNILKRYPPPFSWVEQLVFAQADAGIAGNAEAADVLRAKGYRGPLYEIPQMGVELERFAPDRAGEEARIRRKEELGLDKEAFWVGFFGRLVEEKGIQTLFEAMARLPRHEGRRAVKALIVGSGPYADELGQLAARLDLGTSVRFLPAVLSENVADYLKAIDCLCLPSLTRANWKEQFGRVLVEAMAAEAVVVGSSSGEIPLVIGDAGLIFPEGDSGALSEALDRLAARPELVTDLRRKGAERVRQNYTNDLIATRFAQVFQEVAARRGTRRT